MTVNYNNNNNNNNNNSILVIIIIIIHYIELYLHNFPRLQRKHLATSWHRVSLKGCNISLEGLSVKSTARDGICQNFPWIFNGYPTSLYKYSYYNQDVFRGHFTDYHTHWSVWNNIRRVFLTQWTACGNKGKGTYDDGFFDLWIYAKIWT